MNQGCLPLDSFFDVLKDLVIGDLIGFLIDYFMLRGRRGFDTFG